MYRILSILLSFCIVFALCGCGLSDNENQDHTSESDAETGAPVRVAVISAYGDISDLGYNQTIYETCQRYCEDSNLDFNYYKSESDSDEARIAAIATAVSDGYNVLVTPGSAFSSALLDASERYPEVKFIGLDIAVSDLLSVALGDKYDGVPGNWTATDYYHSENVYCADFPEEIAGYMAGVAAVRMGYSHLGFLGSTSHSSIKRYGYGFVQGADAAAAAIGGDVSMTYCLTDQIAGDDALTEAMASCYEDGIEVVFACGGNVITSAAEAAEKTDVKIIGADVDQSKILNDRYRDGMTLTSAAKKISSVLNDVLTAANNDHWENFAGRTDSFGLVSSEEPDKNYVFLPAKTTVWSDSFSEDDYNALVSALIAGELSVSDDISADAPSAEHIHLTVTHIESAVAENSEENE